MMPIQLAITILMEDVDYMDLTINKKLRFIWDKFIHNNGYKGVVYGYISNIDKGLFTIKWEDNTTGNVNKGWIEKHCQEIKVQ